MPSPSNTPSNARRPRDRDLVFFGSAKAAIGAGFGNEAVVGFGTGGFTGGVAERATVDRFSDATGSRRRRSGRAAGTGNGLGGGVGATAAGAGRFGATDRFFNGLSPRPFCRSF